MLAAAAHADIITLKDGSKLNGKVLSEDTDSYLLEVQVSQSIKDERRVPKDQVASIERESPQLNAFKKIAKLVPTPDALDQSGYEARIQQVEKFIDANLTSSISKEARPILKTLKEEAALVAAGGIKINGRMLQPDEYRANALELDASLQEAAIRARISDGDLLRALRLFSEFDRDFRGTSKHAALLPLIQKVIASYLAGINHELATLDQRLKKRDIGLERMTHADRMATRRALAEETAQLEARLKKEKDAKIGWVTPHPFFKPALDDTIAFGNQELIRLRNPAASQSTTDPAQAYREAWRAIVNTKDPAVAASAIQNARSAMVAPKYIELLEKAAGQSTTP